MSLEMDRILCKADGKLTFYRMKKEDNKQLREIQTLIQQAYDINKNKISNFRF